MATKRELNFTKDRETKGTYRFAEEGDNPIVGNLYVKKEAFAGGAAPDKLKVTVAW